ncbi:hypothetical protein I3760_06G173300 [Carya illinoinensis]|uniref:Uncharacterized protein n=1 Tax=Carya illinoinensis TaxID=32201 RepID=A0A8T1QCK7_CARIL|nr:uncharacterized protein LOC122313279 [Carya illinoinensis]KAG2704180.1 hypothetical protein I3760_06G173300 [Carya illinoinensis]KAG2704181.1 hypothetical protein I3760_06G173300 [Carya illinoinensis]KAG6652259.1 hypothetical protein CIPAW_06G171900 [Carya illinoinensis]KAG6652260.1 hypothetical protein CIPAW_06G171900 [Carya illinoinensis]
MHMDASHSKANTWGSYSAEEPRSKTCNSSDLVRNWQKINFERNVPVLDSTADSQVVLRSPWIRHFTSSGKRRCIIMIFDSLEQNLVGSPREASDKNFAEEDQGEKLCIRHP